MTNPPPFRVRGLAEKRNCSLFLYLDSIFFVHVCHPRGTLHAYWICRSSVGPRISYDVRKLTRTPRGIKKKKKHQNTLKGNPCKNSSHPKAQWNHVVKIVGLISSHPKKKKKKTKNLYPY